jgi:hypothetical protein
MADTERPSRVAQRRTATAARLTVCSWAIVGMALPCSCGGRIVAGSGGPPNTGPMDLPACSQCVFESGSSPVSRQQAISVAEAFVRAAGYTEAPAICFKNESVVRASPAEELALRHRSLQPKAWAAKQMKDLYGRDAVWGVVFLYDPEWIARLALPVQSRAVRCPTDAGCYLADANGEPAARVVLVDIETGHVSIAHEDVRLRAFEPLNASDAGGK